MHMLNDSERVDAAGGRVDEIRDKATGELIVTAPHGSALDVTRAIEAAQRGWRAMATVVTNHSTAICLENLPFGGAKMSGNAREGLHETLDMTEQKTPLMSGVFPA